MIPGPDRVISCPACHGLAKHRTLVSGNTFGARTWTDGKQVAPMLPRISPVAACRHCTRCFWLADAEKLGELESRPSGEVDPAWVSADYVSEPTEDGYYSALQEGLAKDKDQEKTLRILAWWRSNDTFRERAVDTWTCTESQRVNLETLLGLLSEIEDGDRLLKAEALRELGRFDEAIEILGRPVSPEHAGIIVQLRSLCERRLRCVQLLAFEKPANPQGFRIPSLPRDLPSRVVLGNLFVNFFIAHS